MKVEILCKSQRILSELPEVDPRVRAILLDAAWFLAGRGYSLVVTCLLRTRKEQQKIFARAMELSRKDDLIKRIEPPTPEEMRLARKRLGLTQVELAEKLGIGQGCVSAWEVGRSSPGAQPLRLLARLLRRHEKRSKRRNP